MSNESDAAFWQPSRRYPDAFGAKSSIRALRNTGSCSPMSSGFRPTRRAGRKGRSGSATGVICCGATCRAIRFCAGTRRPDRPACSASPPTMPTAIPATARAGWSPASMTAAASPAPNMTAPSPSSPTIIEGKKFNSPNDVVVKSDGSIWFTDPRFGILSYYEGHIAEPELPMNVYRVDGKTGALSDRRRRHRGAERALLFARREEALHRGVAQRAAPHSRLRRERRRRQARQPQNPDRCRPAWNARRLPLRHRRQSLVRLGHDTRRSTGCMVFSPQGEPIGKIALPERCANVCFGGRHRNRLFMAASHSLYALYVNTQGAPGG